MPACRTVPLVMQQEGNSNQELQDIDNKHIHITEDFSVAVWSRVQAVNCFIDCF